MRFICKRIEPEVFIDWKQKKKNRNKIWKNFNSPIKQAVRDSLLQEQGFICCYCEGRIAAATCHIDHLIPKSLDFSKTFDYSNLLASCIGEEEADKEPKYCGHFRGRESIEISPLDKRCTQAFGYTEDGRIFALKNSSCQDEAARTIEQLNLNFSELQKRRRAAISSFIDSIQLEEIDKLVEQLEGLNSKGEYEEFCSAIVHVLKQNLMA